MHELSVVEGLIRTLTREADLRGFTHISRVELEVGVLRGLDVRQLEGCFDLFVDEDLLRGAKLEISEIPVDATCRACGTSWTSLKLRMSCPTCGGYPELTGGRSLQIASFDAV